MIQYVIQIQPFIVARGAGRLPLRRDFAILEPSFPRSRIDLDESMFLDAILSTETIAGILIIGALAMSVRSILFFTREASSMAPRLQKIDSDLNRFREGMTEKKTAVKDLNVIVDTIEGSREQASRVLRSAQEHRTLPRADRGRERRKRRGRETQAHPTQEDGLRLILASSGVIAADTTQR